MRGCLSQPHPAWGHLDVAQWLQHRGGQPWICCCSPGSGWGEAGAVCSQYRAGGGLWAGPGQAGAGGAARWSGGCRSQTTSLPQHSFWEALLLAGPHCTLWGLGMPPPPPVSHPTQMLPPRPRGHHADTHSRIPPGSHGRFWWRRRRQSQHRAAARWAGSGRSAPCPQIGRAHV